MFLPDYIKNLVFTEHTAGRVLGLPEPICAQQQNLPFFKAGFLVLDKLEAFIDTQGHPLAHGRYIEDVLAVLP